MVIPALDEASRLAASVTSALAIADEVIVSDGGSSDGTPEIARRLGARVVNGAAGRGAQLNRGARAASGDVLLFLHADTVVPEELRRQIEDAVARGAGGGGCAIRFDPGGPLMRFGAGWINRRTRLFRIPLGDQAQFLTREAFDELGGYRDWPILEDLDLMRRLRRSATIAILDGPVVTSSRRFRALGVVPTIARNWTIWTLFALGVSPARLAALYRNRR